jgi:hypothetical protein
MLVPNELPLPSLLQCTMSPLLAQSGHSQTEFQCLLLGAKRTLSPTGRDFVEGIKRHDPKWGEVMTEDFDLPGASTDFLVGSMYDAEATKADDEIRKYRDEQMRERTRDSHTAETQAKLRYRDSNCSLIQ